jgi:hypothetical protein
MKKRNKERAILESYLEKDKNKKCLNNKWEREREGPVIFLFSCTGAKEWKTAKSFILARALTDLFFHKCLIGLNFVPQSAKAWQNGTTLKLKFCAYIARTVLDGERGFVE